MVEPPTTSGEYAKLCRSIQTTQQNVKRWESSHPENSRRAQAYLQLQESARSIYRASQTPDDRRQAALQGQAAFAKQLSVVNAAVAKLGSIGREGYALAVDSNQTQESLPSGAPSVPPPSLPYTNPVASDDHCVLAEDDDPYFDAEVAALNAETDAALAAIVAGNPVE